MTIDQLLELCKIGNVVQSPRGVIVQKDFNGWRAGIVASDGSFYFPYVNGNTTAERAMADLHTHCELAARKRASETTYVAESVRAAVDAVLKGASREV